MRFKIGARRFTDLLLRVGANIVVHGSIICPDGITFPGGLLRTRDERARRHAAERCDHFAAVHSMTSSAIESGPGGMVSPSDLAVLRLMTKSNLVGCNTGMSFGFSPLRMRPT